MSNALGDTQLKRKEKIMGFFSKALGKVGGLLNDMTGVTDSADRAYSQNVALWNMQNQYNTPAAQIARMREAGIDVNPMTYAVGNGNMSTVASSPSPASVGVSGVNPISAVMSVVSGIQDLKRRDLENQLLEKDIEHYVPNHSSPWKEFVRILDPKVWKEVFSNKKTLENAKKNLDSMPPMFDNKKYTGGQYSI